MNEREPAVAVEIGVGGVNYFLNTIVKKGLVELGNFSSAEDK